MSFDNNPKIRKPGICKVKVEMSEDFDELPPELLSKFYNKISFIELMRNSPLVGVELDIDRKIDTEKVKNTFLRLNNLAKEMNLGKFDWEEFEKYRDEGRK